MTSPIGRVSGGGGLRFGIVFFLMALFLCAASEAKADTVSMQLTGVPSGAPVLEVSNNDSSGGYTNVYAYIDPYQATITSGSTTTSALVWCVDPDHEASIGDPWTANVTLPGSTGLADHTYQQNATLYEELAGLVSLLANTSNSQITRRQEIQAAIWSLADSDFSYQVPSGDNSTNFNNAVQGFINNAANTAVTSGFEVLSDITGNVPGAEQEFIVLTPEPATILLLGVGILALGLLGRRKLIAV
jgi:hypothetical protein